MNFRDENNAGMSLRPKVAFQSACRCIKIKQIAPLRLIKASVLQSRKYQQIRASIIELGLVEPPVVTQAPKHANTYYLVDGHLRLEVLKELGVEDVECLVTDDDDTYTYNKRVNRLAAVQDHKMIVRALEQGVSAERLAKSLGLAPETIRMKFRLLNGICPEAVELLANVNCPGKVFDMLRQMRPIRQIEAAELMIGQKNFTVQFARALVAASSPEQLTSIDRTRGNSNVSVESMARIRRPPAFSSGAI
jgi:hypothetical protein